jgi:hypothetical protein
MRCVVFFSTVENFGHAAYHPAKLCSRSELGLRWIYGKKLRSNLEEE